MSGTVYQEKIREILRRLVGSESDKVDLRHVEAWIRANHATLDGLSDVEFEQETILAYRIAVIVMRSTSETLARSFGL
jgi:hypothetical protein